MCQGYEDDVGFESEKIWGPFPLLSTSDYTLIKTKFSNKSD